MIWAAERVEPQAGWGGIVALIVAAGLFYAGNQLRIAFGPWLRDRLGRPSPAGPAAAPPQVLPGKAGGRGHLYVVEFSTGTVKVGKTRRPDKRIGEHEREAAAFGGRISDRWVSAAHDGYDTAEDALIDACCLEGKQIKREYFAGLPFDRAVELAQAAVAAAGPSGDGPELTNPVVVGLPPGGLLGRVRAVLAAATAEQPRAAVPAAAAPPPAPAGSVVPFRYPLDEVELRSFDRPDPVAVVAPGEHGPAIQDVLNHAGLDARVVRYRRGPIASRYELTAQPGVSLERVRRVASSIAGACKVDAVTVALVAGRGTIGVDVPNTERDLVDLGDVLAEARTTAPLALGLGMSVDGPVAPDLARMPHLLIGGASLTGKSSVVNAIVCSLIRRSPDVVGLILIDPKRVELAAYGTVPHLALPVVVEARHAAGALEWVVREIETRYQSFADAGVKNLDGYNQRSGGANLRHLVVVIDELADLMGTVREDIEGPIVTIAEQGRAAGVHLVLATQRPEVAVVTGRIKANIPARLALTTTTNADSRIILDRSGAENLKGSGDALFSMPGTALTRLQCTWVDEAAVAAAVQAAVGGDDLTQLREAARLVLEVGHGSASMLQSRMQLGWPAARRLLSELEARGVVGPADGNRPRAVLLAADRLDQAMQAWR